MNTFGLSLDTGKHLAPQIEEYPLEPSLIDFLSLKKGNNGEDNKVETNLIVCNGLHT